MQLLLKWKRCEWEDFKSGCPIIEVVGDRGSLLLTRL